MNSSFRRTIAAALPAVLVFAACRTTPREPVSTRVQPATQAGASRPPTAAATGNRPRYNEADVRFMQGMIAHHAQAARMVSLVPTRSGTDGVRVIAKRIDVSQRDEIRMMQRWLADRHEPIPHPDLTYPGRAGGDTSSMSGMSMSGGHEALMPGMLTREQMAQLAAATGTAFDRRFLQGMIRHHQGALTMVKQLFGTPGATQESQIFEFATDVDAGQRAEISRMRALLDALPGGSPQR